MVHLYPSLSVNISFETLSLPSFLLYKMTESSQIRLVSQDVPLFICDWVSLCDYERGVAAWEEACMGDYSACVYMQLDLSPCLSHVTLQDTGALLWGSASLFPSLALPEFLLSFQARVCCLQRPLL